MFRKIYSLIIFTSFGFYIPQVIAEDADSFIFFFGFEFYQHDSSFNYKNDTDGANHIGAGLNFGFVVDDTHRISLSVQTEQENSQYIYFSNLNINTAPQKDQVIPMYNHSQYKFWMPTRFLISYDYMHRVGRSISVFLGASIGQSTYQYSDTHQKTRRIDTGTGTNWYDEKIESKIDKVSTTVLATAIQGGVELGSLQGWRIAFLIQYFFEQSKIKFSGEQYKRVSQHTYQALPTIVSESTDDFDVAIDGMQETIISVTVRRYF